MAAPAAICATACTASSSSKATTTTIVAGEFPTQRSHEYGSWIIEAMETNKPVKIAGNVPNTGLITNLPNGCCVEVPCLVDASGIQPTVVGNLPAQLAALNRTNINVQSLIVEAALIGRHRRRLPRRHARPADRRRLHVAADPQHGDRTAGRPVALAAAIRLE